VRIPAEATVRIWKRRFGRDLNEEDARQITDNVVGFFTLLAAWSLAERQTEDSDPVGDAR
jgi:hypothetical protein